MIVTRQADRLIKDYFDAAVREGGFRAVGNLPNPAPGDLAAAYDRLSTYIASLETREAKAARSYFAAAADTAMSKAAKHRILSFWKSFLRIIGFGILPFSLRAAAALLILAEVLGVLEEVYGACASTN
jgi:hypothetical protein